MRDKPDALCRLKCKPDRIAGPSVIILSKTRLLIRRRRAGNCFFEYFETRQKPDRFRRLSIRAAKGDGRKGTAEKGRQKKRMKKDLKGSPNEQGYIMEEEGSQPVRR
ncbi:MAG TPA: hypothetical protein H9684_09400 [Firmicutes bacterium]|nr:hypothetical protein [Bacillota bacterium]